MPFPIKFKASAARELVRHPQEAQLRLLFAFTRLTIRPTRVGPGLEVKQLRGHPGFLRLTVGPWRGASHFDGSVIRFYAFGHRSSIYTQFESTR